MALILLVEDKESMRKMLKQALQSEGHQVVLAKDGREGIQKFKESKVDLVVSDLRLPYKTGMDVLEAVKESQPLTPVILMTAFGTIETAVKAVKVGAYDFLTKPFDPDHLLFLIKKALEKQRLVTENIILKEAFAKHLTLPRIIGKSSKMLEVVDTIKKVAPNTTTVLLLGESGTGKELFARAVHYLSPRKEEAFIAINCAAIPRDLLESELFGHEKGAFTGAVGRKMGKFELASKGSIFLDEIGDMDLALQGKLLRVLEGESYMRVGGTVKIKVNVRVIAATNKDLQTAIADRVFREDLYYRLAVFPVVIPPLRERREDIPALVEHFLSSFCLELKKEPKNLSPGAKEVLNKHPWTGNVRELQNCIERAVILSDGPDIKTEHLGLKGKVQADPDWSDLPAEGTLHEVGSAASHFAEARLIRKVLEGTGGNKSKAADILKVSYKTLLTKIKDFGI